MIATSWFTPAVPFAPICAGSMVRQGSAPLFTLMAPELDVPFPPAPTAGFGCALLSTEYVHAGPSLAPARLSSSPSAYVHSQLVITAPAEFDGLLTDATMSEPSMGKSACQLA